MVANIAWMREARKVNDWVETCSSLRWWSKLARCVPYPIGSNVHSDIDLYSSKTGLLAKLVHADQVGILGKSHYPAFDPDHSKPFLSIFQSKCFSKIIFCRLV